MRLYTNQLSSKIDHGAKMSRLQYVWSSHQKLLISHSKKEKSGRHHCYFRPGFKIASNRKSFLTLEQN